MKTNTFHRYLNRSHYFVAFPGCEERPLVNGYRRYNWNIRARRRDAVTDLWKICTYCIATLSSVAVHILCDSYKLREI